MKSGLMHKSSCVSSRCHMSTADVSGAEVRLQSRELAVDELCITEGMRQRWEGTEGDKKMCEYKSTARWGEAARVEKHQIEFKVWKEPKAMKAWETRTVGSEWDWDSILEMILCSLPALYPKGVSPPATTFSFLFDDQSRDPIILSLPYTQLSHTHRGTFAKIQAPKHACI